MVVGCVVVVAGCVVVVGAAVVGGAVAGGVVVGGAVVAASRDGRWRHSSAELLHRALHLVAHVGIEGVPRACRRRHLSMAGDRRRRDVCSGRPLVRTPRHERDLRSRGRVDRVALREPREGAVARVEGGRCRRHGSEVADEAHELIEALTAARRVSGDRSGEAARTPFPARRLRGRRGSCRRCRASPSDQCGTRTSPPGSKAPARRCARCSPRCGARAGSAPPRPRAGPVGGPGAHESRGQIASPGATGGREPAARRHDRGRVAARLLPLPLPRAGRDV